MATDATEGAVCWLGLAARAWALVASWVALVGLAGCQSALNQPPAYQPAPNTRASHPTPPPLGHAATDEQVEQCVDDCTQSQNQHPEETPYDCRTACLTGEMR